MFYNDDDPTSTIWRDVLFLVLAGFIVIIILMIPWINPEGKKQEENAPPPGSIIVAIKWQDDLDTDVDLWVKAPGDVPVGYSNKGGKVFNLLRDDLGTRNDPMNLNYENAYSRGILPGEYIVNLHLYRNESGVFPIEVEVYVGIKRDKSQSMTKLYYRRVKLYSTGEEITVIRFKIDERKQIIPESESTLFVPLRSARSFGSSSAVQ